jgi:hypothetical protein
LAEEKVSESFEIATTSSYFVIAQKPPPDQLHGCQWTDRARRSLKRSCGTPCS